MRSPSIANQLRPSCSFIQIDPEVVAHEQPDSGPRGDRTEKPFANVLPRGAEADLLAIAEFIAQ